ncbi:MAG: DEAD/DEAH box helicase [Verrucomicrobiota bacterium]
MNPDRATLAYLNSFSEATRNEGAMMQDEGAVAQIFGDHIKIHGRVIFKGESHRVTLKLEGDHWTGESSAEDGLTSEICQVATMLERLKRGEDLPESPNEVEGQSLEETLEERLGRPLNDDEGEFVGKLERRFRRYEIEQEVYGHDLVRLNGRWEIDSYEPLKLWPVPPFDIIDFWNYIAHAFKKRGLTWPDFMSAITDLDATEERMRAWERENEIRGWREQVGEVNAEAPVEGPEAIEFRLMVTTNEGRLQYRMRSEDEFVTLGQTGDLHRLQERFEEGALRMSAASELLWSALVQNWNVTDELRFRLESEETCQLFNRLFQQSDLEESIVTLDEEPFFRGEAALKWICREQMHDKGALLLALVTGSGEEVTHVMRILPGVDDLYLSDEGLFRGPRRWMEGTEVQPVYEVPREVLESESGVEFLGRIDAELPAYLQERVTDEVMDVTLKMSLTKRLTAAQSEHLLVEVIAGDARGTREEVLKKEGWTLELQREDKDGRILRYNRGMLHRFPRWLEPMALVYDANVEAFKARVTKNFPVRFTEWVGEMPDGVLLELDDALESLRREPVRATVQFEVEESDIDWFDLKVVVNVEGHDLSQEEIKALVAARGGYVRTANGEWLRLEIGMEDKQREAVARLGLDPFDLTGETHRMHVLQLAEPLAKEVFDNATWERISERAETLKLQVRPAPPKGLNAELRPYQIEGFHYLAYLSTNRFGGILADDMGLGKTVQSLTWLLWLWDQTEIKKPSLVVCPKSVLDVWKGEVSKFAPDVRIQVLRNKTELEPARLENNEIDLLVVNYSQLRVCEEALKKIPWLAIILDEGQQIKNPDSKAAKVARALQGENRLVLTGTPIENRLLDIWSLMAFAMPGVLGNRKYFRDRFDRRKDPESQTRLAARLRPFLLRRAKSQVAVDLPPKTEEDVLCKMEGVQEELYQGELERIQKMLLGYRSEQAFNKERFVVLQGLMRLRQICCHPGLIDPKYLEEESAKMTALFYLLDQLREEGHKVLVFSQFVTMLDIIREKLEEDKRPFNYLTGQTKNRQEVIEEFQRRKDASVFLLSLKAGGSGLNLTASSYVVLYDPWWNPAVEAQAIDRTHRIGQRNNVIAYRLLMRGSVEEKIRVLQTQKTELTAGVLAEEGFARNLRLKDVKDLFEIGRSGGDERRAKQRGKGGGRGLRGDEAEAALGAVAED